jgi:hypothetical protein
MNKHRITCLARARGIACCAAGLALVSAFANGAGTNAAPKLELLTPTTIVKGVPCLVALEIQNQPLFHRLSQEEAERMFRDARGEYDAYMHKMDTESVRFEETYPFNPHARVTVQIIGSADVQVVKVVPPIFGTSPVRLNEGREVPPRTTFGPGTSGQVIFEISRAFDDVPAGEYRVILTVHSGGAQWPGGAQSWQSAPSRPFKLIQLSENAAAQVRKVFPQLNPLQPPNDREFQSLTWTYWLLGVTNDIAQSQKLMQKEVTDQLAAHLYVAKAVQLGAVEKLTTEDLDGFPPHLQGLADIFRYEVLYRQGKREVAAQIWQAARTNQRAFPDDFFYNAPSTNRLSVGLLEGLIRSQRPAVQSPN